MPFTVDKRLREVLKPGVFGLAAYQTLKSAPAALNVHANSSPRFASNMRLFEITGVGTCMLTDWKENLQALFAPDAEVVTYRSTSECVEKARWLLDHPAERAAIAAAGQRRVLAEHTYVHRARELDPLIRRELAASTRRP
jgi:spore maturation protein CgeB